MPAHPSAALIRETLTGRPIGVVGLGALGLAVARRISSCGLRVVGWDSDAQRRAALASLGGLVEPAASATDLGHDCDVVLSTVPAAELLVAAIGDIDRPGFALSMAPGSLLVDLGVAMPSDAQRLAALLGRGGIGVVDAPALGPASAAETGDLLLAAGGFGDFVERLEPLLGLIGTTRAAGTQGRGHALAALMVYARDAEAEAARETLAVALACGLSAELLPDVAAAAAAGPASDDARLAIARSLAADLAGPRYNQRSAGA